jgi:hypothetical protein
MSHVCRRCSRVNPPEALFCYFDGIALDTHHRGGPVAAGVKLFPTPFVFPSGRLCRNFDELVHVCDEDWNSARDLLYEGFLESFLGGLGRADLAMAARQAAKETDRDRGLDQFLNKLPAGNRAEAKLGVQPLEINLGQLNGERRFLIHLQNQGGGLLHGSIAGDDTKWLAFGDAPGTPQKLFQCQHDQEIAVHVVGKNLRASNKSLEGRIVVESNGGTAIVMVRAEKPVQPFPEGVLAGAKLPREIASKAKHHPKEAALLFEKGAVQDWYEANGWTYPVQGPASSGLGAIQQFYEALGLVQAPKVAINQQQIQFHGKPGQFLEQLIQLHTVEKRPVYAHATTNTPWLKIGRPMLEGRTASIPIRVPSIPTMPGERLRGTVQVTANGNQRFTVEVELAVAASFDDWHAPAPMTVPAIAVSSAVPLEPSLWHGLPTVPPTPTESLPEHVGLSKTPLRPSVSPVARSGDRATTEGPRWQPVEAVETLEVVKPAMIVPTAAVAAFSPTPAVSASRADFDDSSQAVPLLPFVTPVVPILLLGVAMLFVLLHDLLFVSAEGGTPKPFSGDKTPLLALRFHDSPKPGRDGADAVPYPSMRFGLFMRREDSKGGVGLTDDDLRRLKEPGPADLTHFKRLTFDDWGRTNNTCLKIDGGEHFFGDASGRWLMREEPISEGEQGVRSVWLHERSKVEVTQIVELVPGSQSGRYDTCLIRYAIANKDSKPHAVGIRFLLDTYIGDNDGVPFTIPGESSLCETMTVFETPEQVPDYIQALEKPDLRNPGTVAHIQFRVGSKLESPTRVLLGGWPDKGLKIVSSEKYPEANDHMTGWKVPLVSMELLHRKTTLKDGGGKPPKDSAVTLYWDPQRLDPGKTRDVGFTYGLGNVSSSEGEGRLLLTVGGRLVRDAEFTLTALVANPKPGEQLMLTLPQGLKLAGGSATQPAPPGAARATSTVTWKIRAIRDGEYNLQVRSSNGQTQSQSITIRSTGVFD